MRAFLRLRPLNGSPASGDFDRSDRRFNIGPGAALTFVAPPEQDAWRTGRSPYCQPHDGINNERVRTIIEQLGPGDHAALFYRNRAEQFAVAIPYIEIGLSRNERCLYIAGDNSLPIVLEAMEAGGIDVNRAQADGRLTVATPDQTYLRHGIFEPTEMAQGLKQEIQLSLEQGFSAFRATGEMGWAASLPSALLRLYEYERMVDADLHPSFAVLCQYSEGLFREDILAQMLCVHPKIIARGSLYDNPHYVPPGQASHPYSPPITLDAFAATARAFMPGFPAATSPRFVEGTSRLSSARPT